MSMHSFLWKANIKIGVTVYKKGKGKVKGMLQSQTFPRHQEEEETDKSEHAQIKQTYEKHQD